MSFQVCSCCRQSFPVALVQSASFSEEVGNTFTAVFDSLKDITGKNDAERNELQKLKLRLQSLCGKVNEEVAQLRERLSKSEEMLSFRPRETSGNNNNSNGFGDTFGDTTRRSRMNLTAGSRGSTARNGGTLGFSSSQSNQRASFLPAVGTAGGFNASVGNGDSVGAAASARLLFGGAVPPNRVKKMNSAFELVSASIYALVESLAIQARVDTALLWIKPKGSMSVELVAPFVVGRDISKIVNSAPYRVPETSLPCAVSTTGIAVNLKPRTGADGLVERTTARSEDLSITELTEGTNAAQLLVPVFARYESCTRVHKQVIAVIHLIGSPRYPFPFNRRNEAAAMQGANFLSTILSAHHEVMVTEWTNRIYDPEPVVGTSTYRGDLDLRGDEKSDDDFAQPPTLIYRCVNERRPDDDPRDAYKAMRSAIVRRAVPPEPVSTIKDLHRHAANMESNWADAVEHTTRLETMVGTLQEDALVGEVRKLKSTRDNLLAEEAIKTGTQSSWVRMSVGENSGNTSAQPSRPATSVSRAGKKASVLSSINSADMALTELTPERVVVSDANQRDMEMQVLKPEQVDALEFVSLKRLQSLGVDPTPFLSTDMAQYFSGPNE